MLGYFSFKSCFLSHELSIYGNAFYIDLTIWVFLFFLAFVQTAISAHGDRVIDSSLNLCSSFVPPAAALAGPPARR